MTYAKVNGDDIHIDPRCGDDGTGTCVWDGEPIRLVPTGTSRMTGQDQQIDLGDLVYHPRSDRVGYTTMVTQNVVFVRFPGQAKSANLDRRTVLSVSWEDVWADVVQDDLNAMIYRTDGAQRLVTPGDHFGWSVEIDVRISRTIQPLRDEADRSAAFAYHLATLTLEGARR